MVREIFTEIYELFYSDQLLTDIQDLIACRIESLMQGLASGTLVGDDLRDAGLIGGLDLPDIKVLTDGLIDVGFTHPTGHTVNGQDRSDLTAGFGIRGGR